MNHYLFIIANSLLLFYVHNTMAGAIIKCVQADGTIEFTNKSCSKNGHYQSKSHYQQGSKHRRSAFLQADFLYLQKNLIHAETQGDIEQQAHKIINKINTYAQQGKINSAYNMTAATYAKLAKYIKEKQWRVQSINKHLLPIRSLFEDILLSQSTTLTSGEFNQAVETALLNYKKLNYQKTVNYNDP